MTDLILNMVSKAAKQDAAFLVDLASLQEKHVAAAKELLGDGPMLSAFIARLLEDIGNLKAMLQAGGAGGRWDRGAMGALDGALLVLPFWLAGGWTSGRCGRGLPAARGGGCLSPSRLTGLLPSPLLPRPRPHRRSASVRWGLAQAGGTGHSWRQ